MLDVEGVFLVFLFVGYEIFMEGWGLNVGICLINFEDWVNCE